MNVSNNKRIQSTNDSSIVSKLSTVKKGYFNDDFLQYFVNKSQNRSSLINRGYYIRFKAVEAATDAWLNLLQTSEFEGSQIISLGAGFDSTYFRLKSQEKLPELCKYIEVDFFDVLNRKLSFIKARKELQYLIPGDISSMKSISGSLLNASTYALLAADLNDTEKLYSLFVEAGINFNLPTLFLAECSITYMNVDKSDNLIKWVRESFPDSLFITYEQVYPNDGFGIVMQKHFSSLGTSLKSINTYTNLLSQRERFSNMGWTACVKGMNEFFTSLPADEKTRMQNLELFDEYETWHETCSHYILIWASQGSIPLNPRFDGVVKGDHHFKLALLRNLTVMEACPDLHRFGHQITCVGGGNILVTGGFGKFHGKHQKLGSIICYNIETMKIQEISIDDEGKELGQRMFHTMVQLKDCLLVIGGRSAPSKPYNHSVALYLYNELNMEVKDKTSNRNTDVSWDDVERVKFRCQVISVAGSIPPARWRHSASVLEIAGTEMVFLFAGSTAAQKATNDCFLLNTTTWTWSEVPLQNNTPTETHSHSAVALGANVFVSGGLSRDEEPMQSVYRFEADTLTWFELDVCGVLLPRYSHTSHIWKNHLFLVGGVNHIPDHSPFVAMINLTTLHVTEFSMPSQDPEYPILLWNHESIVYQGEIITFGGGGNCFSFGTHFNAKLLKIDLDMCNPSSEL